MIKSSPSPLPAAGQHLRRINWTGGLLVLVGIGMLAVLGKFWLQSFSPAAPAPVASVPALAATVNPPTATPPGSTATPAPALPSSTIPAQAEAQVIVLAGQINYQPDDAPAAVAGPGQAIRIGPDAPAGAALRLWTTTQPARLQLAGQVSLALDQATSVDLLDGASPSQAPTLRMGSGTLLVLAGSLTVQSSDSRYRAVSSQAGMGVTFTRSQGLFEIDCLGPQGSCLLVDDQGSIVVPSGQSLAYTSQGLGQSHPVDFAAWTALGGPVQRASAVTYTPTTAPLLATATVEKEKKENVPVEKPKPPEPPGPYPP